jgi:DNA polymerase-3 subunit epsilon
LLLTEDSRASLGNMQAAMLEDLISARRLPRDPRGGAAGASVARRVAAQIMKTRWPLEDMRGTDGRRRAGESKRRNLAWSPPSTKISPAGARLLPGGWPSMPKIVWLRADAGGQVHLDLVWSGQAVSTEALAGWETDPIRVGSARSVC